MPQRPERRPLGSIVIKNNTGAEYIVEELFGYVLAIDGEIDLLNAETDYFYRDWDAANRLVTNLPTAKLYQDIQSGDIFVIVNDKTVVQE